MSGPRDEPTQVPAQVPATVPATVLDGAQRRGHEHASPDRRMLESLVCPVTQGRLDYDREAQELISPAARLAYPIREGIPIMLADEARRLDG